MQKQYFAEYLVKEAKTLVIVDGNDSHQANVLGADSHLRVEKLPPCSPELNPAERFFSKEVNSSKFQAVEVI